MLESIKKVDKKIIIMAGMLLAIIVVIVIAIIVMSLTSSSNLSFEKIEEKLVIAAENYIGDNEDKLPKKVGEKIEINIETLLSGGYIKDLSEYTDENVKCGAKVIVAKTVSNYDYVPVLDCGKEYKTEFLYKKLLENVVTSGNGLYSFQEVVKYGEKLGFDETGYDLSSNELMRGYIYRGENVNNYIKLDNELYRIVKIDGNSDLIVLKESALTIDVYDDRYNAEVDDNYGINDYRVSRIYETLTNTFNDLSSDSLIKQKVVGKNICTNSRSENETITDGSVECAKVMKDQYYSLIPVFDIMNASLSEDCLITTSKSCKNYNYLLNYKFYWTLTTSTINSYSAYRANYQIETNRLYTSANYRIVYHLSNRLVYVSGTGTQADPYIVK